jgi:hypothetical protein
MEFGGVLGRPLGVNQLIDINEETQIHTGR